MKRNIFLVFVIIPLFAQGQTETTNELVKRFDHNGAFTLYFYKNTLRMLNQSDDKDFDEAVKNIEKLRFLVLDKDESKFGDGDYKKLVGGYKGESYEAIMTTRMSGRNFDVFLKDKKGSSLGTVILVNDSSRLIVMDMIGTIDLKKATSLFSQLEQNSDIKSKIQSFLKKDKDVKGKKQEIEIH